MNDTQHVYSPAGDPENDAVRIEEQVKVLRSEKSILGDRRATLRHPFERADLFLQMRHKS